MEMPDAPILSSRLPRVERKARRSCACRALRSQPIYSDHLRAQTQEKRRARWPRRKIAENRLRVRFGWLGSRGAVFKRAVRGRGAIGWVSDCRSLVTKSAMFI
jgi:hypothetical protein